MAVPQEFQLVDGLEGFCRMEARYDALGQVFPAEGSFFVYQEFGWARDVVSVLGCMLVEDAVSTDGFGVWIGEERERVAASGSKLSRFLRRMCAERYHFDSGREECRHVVAAAQRLEFG